MEWIWSIAIQLALLFVAVYFYLSQKYSHWSRLGIRGPNPSIFKFGNLIDILNAPAPIVEVELARKYGKIYGHYSGLQPILNVNDAALIKQILIKDFHLFVNRRDLGTYHRFWNHNLFWAKDDEWKRLRAITSPTFSSGKLHSMGTMMNKCIDKLVKYLESTSSSSKPSINTKEVMAGFTIDVVASSLFATETNANSSNGQAQSPVVTNGLNLFNFPMFEGLCFGMGPRWFNNLVGVKHAFKNKYFEFFVGLSQSIVKQRLEQKVRRNDLVQLLVEAQVNESELKGTSYDKLAATNDNEETNADVSKQTENQTQKRGLTENEIISQVILFFFGGFETTASTLTNTLFELATNPDIQERLYEDLTQSLDGLSEDSDEYFEKVMTRIPLLDAVIKEVLRKYPPLYRLERKVGVDDYQLGKLTLPKGQHIEISVIAVHQNPEYYPEPERFNPDRFMPENKHLLVPYTYIPFGAGPRNCVGMRFAYQEIKFCLAKIVRQFRFSPVAGETPEKLEFKKFKFLLNVEPFPVRVERRD